MAINLHSFELIDPFGGLQDLHNKILRTPDETFFLEDPLRFYRVMQFIGRFDMYPDDALNSICAQMDLSGVSVERIEGEFEKLLLKSKEPSRGIRWLHAIGRLHEILPELADTISIAQDPVWHPEGDVFEHTMQTVDAAAVLEYNNDYEKLCVVYAALCHDLGKATTTEIVQERIHSYGHMRAGVALAKKMLKRITKKKDVIAAVAKLVRYHFEPIHFVENNAGPSAYKRLARKLAPEVSLQTLAKLALADQRGRNPKGNKPLSINVPAIKTFLQRAAQAAVLEYPEKSVLQGRDLLDVIKPGPKMGELLKRAYEIQLEEGIKNKDELKRRVLQKHMKN
jgi:tRNA nucleotidyltransferase (CCA-adding enzyme)